MKQSLTLICGMPRSGTTWIGKIFDSHPDTLYRHEPDSDRLRFLPLVASPDDAEKYDAAILDFVEQLPRLSDSRAAGSWPVFPKRFQSSTHLWIKKVAVLATKASEHVIGNLPVMDFTNYESIAGLHVVWKSIESLGRLSTILNAVPACRVIVILRHPCGYVASVRRGEESEYFPSSISSSDDFPVFDMLLRRSPHKERNPGLEDLVGMSPVERLTWRWLLYNEIALADIAGSASCFSLRYEDICSEPAAKAKNILQFAGLCWHRQVGRFIDRSTQHRSDHYYSIFKDPKDSSNKWRKQLMSTEINSIMNIVRRSDLYGWYSAGNSYRPAAQTPRRLPGYGAVEKGSSQPQSRN